MYFETLRTFNLIFKKSVSNAGGFLIFGIILWGSFTLSILIENGKIHEENKIIDYSSDKTYYYDYDLFTNANLKNTSR